MAVTTDPKLDAHKLRTDFPVFDELVNGKPVAYLDSASSTQKPRQVLDAMREFYEHSYANVHRGVYRLAARATTGYETGRRKVAAYVNAPSEREVVFTRSATEALNLVAYAWGLDNLGRGDVVVVTELEHHSSFVPWQYIAGRTGATFRAIPIDANGELQLEALDVQALGCDFLAISSHKMCGPSGAGALWGRRELLERMSPFNLGGEMIRSVKLDATSW